jgi:hypothetical protein
MRNSDIGRKPEWVKEPPSLDFKVINEPLEGVFRTIVDALKREAVDPYGFHFLLQNLLTTNLTTLRAVVRLIDQEKKTRYPFQAYLLARSIVDSLFTIVALKTDPKQRSRHFELAGYRFLLEKRQREMTRYGDAAEWQNYQKEQEKFLDAYAKSHDLTPPGETDPRDLPHWPIPSQMLRGKDIAFSSEDREFLEEVHVWNYVELSSYEHLNWSGVGLSLFAASPEAHWIPGQLESRVAYTCMLFMLMLLSEVEAFKKYGVAQELRYIWGILGGYADEAKEYYTTRYSKILA